MITRAGCRLRDGDRGESFSARKPVAQKIAHRTVREGHHKKEGADSAPARLKEKQDARRDHCRRKRLPDPYGAPIFFQHERAEFLQCHDYHSQDNSNGAGGAHLLVDKCLAEHEKGGNCRPPAGSTVHPAGQRDDHPGILDGTDDHKDKHQVDRTHNERDLYACELCPPSGAVDACCFVDLFWNVLQLGKMRQHREGTHPRKSPNDARNKNQPRIPSHAGRVPSRKIPPQPKNASRLQRSGKSPEASRNWLR